MEQGMTRRQFVFAGSAATFAALALSACGGSGQGSGSGAAAAADYKDGTYTGTSEVFDEDENGAGYGEITITVQDGAIIDATFEPYDLDGKLKGSDYVVPAVVAAAKTYEEELVETGSIDGVDAESGATYMYDQFVGAVEDALRKAE